MEKQITDLISQWVQWELYARSNRLPIPVKTQCGKTLYTCGRDIHSAIKICEENYKLDKMMNYEYSAVPDLEMEYWNLVKKELQKILLYEILETT